MEGVQMLRPPWDPAGPPPPPPGLYLHCPEACRWAARCHPLCKLSRGAAGSLRRNLHQTPSPLLTAALHG